MTKPFSIVSVEDDVGLSELIKFTLRKLPVEFHHARTGAEAIKLIPKIKADVLILDITLPDIHGWDVLRRLSALNVDLKGVIVLTGRTDAANRVMAHFQDVTAYMNKPFKPAELRKTVLSALDIK